MGIMLVEYKFGHGDHVGSLERDRSSSRPGLLLRWFHHVWVSGFY